MSDHPRVCHCSECWPYKPGSRQDLEARLREQQEEQTSSPARALAAWAKDSPR